MENKRLKLPTGIQKMFQTEISRFIPRNRIHTDALRRLAWGTDAGFYRLIPQIVVHAANEEEVSRLLAITDRLNVAVTFRAAGTSLSGQAISDSVLVVAGKNWEDYTVAPDAQSITMQPGIIGERVNEILKPYGRKFSPDPASVKSAMVGGIVMNNASGMNCGTHANSAKTILAARIVFADGTTLDTADKESRISFNRRKPGFIQGIENLRDKVRSNQPLVNRIRRKYAIKNVMGLNIEPFITHHDPFDILLHLLVGSEGTLAFVSQVTMQTEFDFPHKASAMIYFNDIREACRAVVAMKKLKTPDGDWIVKGAELLDWKSLQSVSGSLPYIDRKADDDREAENREVDDDREAEKDVRIICRNGSTLTAVLTETKAVTSQALQQNISRITEALRTFNTVTPVHFTDKVDEYAKYWAIRSGIFPSVGGTRPSGTTTLIEDVAFHIDDLPEATADLQELLVRHGYDDACIYGHALEGNYHFIINQSFDTQEEIARYEALMNDVVHLVVDTYDGSLKAEHGTGRNMAPFVAYEWGDEAFEIMKAVKRLFDPKGLLNPGVIFNDDPRCHLKNFKPLPLLNPKVDKCIECGFCEVNCLTCGFTLSSRQRIVVQREIARLKAEREANGLQIRASEANEGAMHGLQISASKGLKTSGMYRKHLRKLQRQYRYPGNQTCAGDGLCAMSCPMEINTGDLTHDIRQAELQHSNIGYAIGRLAAKHFSAVKSFLQVMLMLANVAHTVMGTTIMRFMAKAMHRFLPLPLWTPAMPKRYSPRLAKKAEAGKADISRKAGKADISDKTPKTGHDTVVYFPSCINQTIGLNKDSPEKMPVMNEMVALFHKAGYEVIFPKDMDNHCCGTIWESKGMPDIADRKSAELEAALYEASANGRYPVICDQSPCLYRMRHVMQKVKLYEPVEFITAFLLDRLEFVPTDTPVAIHITCSMRKMGLDTQMIELAKRCSSNVIVPEEVGCCGFAGDKGFTRPEVNAYALRKLRPQIEKAGVAKGYCNSRTCEIGLTTNSGIPYQSIVYLVNQHTVVKK